MNFFRNFRGGISPRAPPKAATVSDSLVINNSTNYHKLYIFCSVGFHCLAKYHN